MCAVVGNVRKQVQWKAVIRAGFHAIDRIFGTAFVLWHSRREFDDGGGPGKNNPGHVTNKDMFVDKIVLPQEEFRS